MVETVIYNPVIVLVKVSILLQYITVFVAHRGNLLHYGCHILIWLNVIFYTVLTLVYIFQVSTISDHSAAIGEDQHVISVRLVRNCGFLELRATAIASIREASTQDPSMSFRTL